MAYTPFNEVARAIRGNSNQDGIDTRAYTNILQGIEIRDPLKVKRGVLPKMSMRSIRVDQDGFLDNTIEANDLGQNVHVSTTNFVDTTEKWTPTQIIQNNLASTFLNELVTSQLKDEENDGEISVFSPNGLEVPFTARGTKSSIFGADSYRGWQPVDSKYQFIAGEDEFLDGQETILQIAVPQIQTLNFQSSLPFDDNDVDDTDRFGINILNQNVNLYDRYAAGGFVYSGNDRDSIAFGGLKG